MWIYIWNWNVKCEMEKKKNQETFMRVGGLAKPI